METNFTLHDDGLLAVFLLVKANLVAQDEDKHFAKILFYLLLRFAVVSATALYNIDKDQAATLSAGISIKLKLCLVDAAQNALVLFQHLSLHLLDREKLRVAARKAELLLRARVTLNFLFNCLKLVFTAGRTKEQSFELNLANSRINLAINFLITVTDPNRYVKALFSPENITIVEILFYDGLHDVRAFLLRQSVEFVARVRQQEEGHDERAE